MRPGEIHTLSYFIYILNVKCNIVKYYFLINNELAAFFKYSFFIHSRVLSEYICLPYAKKLTIGIKTAYLLRMFPTSNITPLLIAHRFHLRLSSHKKHVATLPPALPAFQASKMAFLFAEHSGSR